MEAAYRRCCGIDVHKKSVMVRVLSAQKQTEGKALEREFRTFFPGLAQLTRLVNWPGGRRIASIAGDWRAIWETGSGWEFRAPREIRELRDLTCWRVHLLEER